jgi:serine/threonine-protein kinase HipA
LDDFQNGIDLTDSVEDEYLCLKILQALGVPAANAAMTISGDRRVLVLERFDRLWTSDNGLLRLPQEDCCQALSVPPSLKYESDGGPGVPTIARLLEGSDDALAD